METLKNKKKFWLLFLLALIGIGFFIYLVLFSPSGNPEGPKGIPAEFKGDKENPIAKIVEPDANSFQREDFSIKVWDVDTGGSGLENSQCKYSIYNCLQDSCLLTLLEATRNCNEDTPLVAVGIDGNCSSEGINTCRIVVKSKDRAGNSNIVSEEENSIRDFSIDWTPPKVEMDVANLSIIQKDIPQVFSARVSDNIGISNCDFYIDRQGQYQACLEKGNSPQGCAKTIDFSEISCPAETAGQCLLVSKEYAFVTPGSHEIYMSCWDRAGNLGYSELRKIEVSTNHPPQISFCRVIPTRGVAKTNFQFQVEASDSDGDILSYNWKFGDGESSSEQSPNHPYFLPGTYEPRVIVSDGLKEVECSTAWAVVSEQ